MCDFNKEETPTESPEERAGLISKTLFLWTLPFVKDALEAVRENRFNAELLPPIPSYEQPEHNIAVLKELWQEEQRTAGKDAKLARVCFKMMSSTLLLCWAIMSLQALLMMTTPVMASVLVASMQGLTSKATGFLMVVLITGVSALASVLQQGSWHISSRNARQCWLALSGLIFEKPALLSSGNRSDITEGELVNMMAVDAQQVLNFMQFFAIFASAPMYILVPSIIIPRILGWPFAVGFVIFLGTSYCCDLIARKVKDFQAQKLKAADARNLRLNESFQGIRTVKLNGWEDLMEERVEKEREKELRVLRSFHIWQAFQQSLSFGMPTVATVITFMLYVYSGGELGPGKVFMCVGLFEFLTVGTSILPHMMNMLRQLKQHMERMQKLLIKEEDFKRGTKDGLEAGHVICHQADFCWTLPKPGEDPAPPTLDGVSLEALPGQMVAVCGRVGSGKSTWAGGLLGLVTRTRGSVAISGSVAYVTQSPQILNDTIRENILFGMPMDEAWYQKVLAACALTEDIKQFTNGDATEIGERGITISGGQKQRVAIARAAYSRADVLVFDDPLSAMDAHVGKRVFDSCFRGLLNGHTRIFFTNQLQFCEDCNYVYMLEEGTLVEAGPYKELAAKKPLGPFGIFLRSVVGADGKDQELVPAKPRARKEPSGACSCWAGGFWNLVPGAPLRLTEKPGVNGQPWTEATQEEEAEEEPAVQGMMSRTSKSSKSTMSIEVKLTGRIGIKDWMTLARASNAPLLGMGVIVLSALAAVAHYSVSASLSFWTDSLLDDDGRSVSGEAFEDPVPMSLYLSSAGALCVTLFFRGVVCVVYFLKSSKALHRAMLHGTLRQTMGWFDTTPVGRILNRFGNDVMVMDIMLPMLFQMWSLILGRVVVIIIVAGITAPPALLISITLMVFTKFIYSYYGAIALDLSRVQMMALSPLLAAQSSFLGALDSVRCFDRVDVFVRRFYTMQSNFIRTFYWSFSLDRAMQCIFTSMAVSLFYGAVSCMLLLLASYPTPFAGLVTPGSAGVVLAHCAMLAFQAPVALFMTARVEMMMSGVQRVAEYKELPTEDARQAIKEMPPPSWPQRGALTLDNVEMRYQESLPLALKGISLQVAPGEKVAIVGRTGSGKSSLILTCFRLVECAGGRVLLDDRDTSSVPLLELRGRMGVIPQDSWLFSGTVRSNLDVRGDRSDEELWKVLRQVQLETQARGWEAGLDHEVKEKGENLSNGTAQLLCLARVLLKRPRVLFMDEATASVDSETDKLVQETIRKEGVLPAGCSIVTIAHRLHTVIDYDRIVVLSHGRIVEQGAPDELLQQKDGHLAKLVEDTGESSARELRRRATGL